VLFFFSSRRRHTRLQGDWSSDVCSSDLSRRAPSRRPHHTYTAQLIRATPAAEMGLDEISSIPGSLPDLRRGDLPACRFIERCTRSEERRVGKEWGGRGGEERAVQEDI